LVVETGIPAAGAGAASADDCVGVDREAAARGFAAGSTAAAGHLGPSSACQILGAVLPPGARYVGYRYEAEDQRTVGDCLADADCPMGQAVWHGHPAVVRSGQSTAVAALFQNRAGAPRRARFWVFFTGGR
jgi:hypothetical protein